MRNYTMRKEGRSSALWGRRSGSRGRVVRRSLAAAVLAALAVVGPLAGAAEAKGKDYRAFVTPPLLERAEANGDKLFKVIVQSDGSTKGSALTGLIAREAAKGSGSSAANEKAVRGRVKDQFRTIAGVALTLTGKQIVRLADTKGISSITPDAPVELSQAYSNRQLWPMASGVMRVWPHMGAGSSLKLPAIAVVDSGIDRNRSDFSNGARVIVDKTMTALEPNSPGDGRGHGTFVAGIAAGSASGYAGAAPAAPIVSIDVMNDYGMAMTSDVIAAADWIHANRHTYNIRVANFSLHSAVPSSFMYDPLAKAVQKLWFSGVVVVAAAGNYGIKGAPSGVPYAPGNDPFIITVGALDLGEKLNIKDDEAAPWSAYGYTLDGFSKPEIGAPGRYMIGPVPMTSTLALERPGQLRGTGYMELSGTSFASPLVAGMAAYILAKNPTWTPDQVKGALMVSAVQLASADPGSVGVGAPIVDKAAAVKDPPNPNLALNAFLVDDPAGGSDPVFDSASWAKVATEDASWANASWASASWAQASWSSASWASASWAQASWASASWANASWASASWASYSYEDNAAGEDGVGGLVLTPEEEAFLESLFENPLESLEAPETELETSISP